MVRNPGQSIVTVRGDTSLATEIQSLLPTLARRGRVAARMSTQQRTTRSMRTTFCPACGGNKSKQARRCLPCFSAAKAKGRAEVRAAGKRPTFLTGVSRRLPAQHEPSENVRLNQPGLRRLAVGSGHVRPGAAWKRKVLIDGVWQDAPDEEAASET